MKYRQWIEEASKRNESNIVLALDVEAPDRKALLTKCLGIVKKTAPYLCAVKLNFPVVLPLGLYDGTRRIIELAHAHDLPTIMDCKMTDVGHTNRATIEHYFKVGFDAITASPLIGWEEGLGPIIDLIKREGKGVLLLVYMSHKGAVECFEQMVLDPKTKEVSPQYEVYAKKAIDWDVDGIVVGATYPKKISAVRAVVGDAVPIYSPGVGIQGGDIEAALNAGARYLIIGRAIVCAENPEGATKRFLIACRKFFSSAS